MGAVAKRSGLAAPIVKCSCNGIIRLLGSKRKNVREGLGACLLEVRAWRDCRQVRLPFSQWRPGVGRQSEC